MYVLSFTFDADGYNENHSNFLFHFFTCTLRNFKTLSLQNILVLPLITVTHKTLNF